MLLIESEQQLEDALSAPNAADVEAVSRLSGDIIILGAGGKMGPSLARRIKRATEAASVKRRVIAVSRDRPVTGVTGIETIQCDLLDRQQLRGLPDCDNAFFLAGRKFGSSDRNDLTWAINSYLPGLVADRYRASRIVVFSTGNVYPFVRSEAGGSVEGDALDPRGEYANSCLGRERVFEYFSREHGVLCLIFRLNYAVDLRYGVLVDIARNVYAGNQINLSVGSFNAIWQGDALSYAIRSLELCASPPRILNVTGPEIASTKRVAEFYAERFGREVSFSGAESEFALLNNASLCHQLMGYPSVSLVELMEEVAHWVEIGGSNLGKPTKFEASDGRF